MRRSLLLLLPLCLIAAGQEDEVGKPYWVSTPPGTTDAIKQTVGAIATSRWADAARALQTVFDKFPTAFAKTPRSDSFVGARQRAAELLAAAPQAVRTEYERLFGPYAEKALLEALFVGDRRNLLDVVRRYEGTSAGLRAILALADQALLRARPAEARVLLARLPGLHASALADAGVRRRVALAAVRDRAEGGPPLRDWEKDAGAREPTEISREAWPVLGGNAARNRVASAPVFRDIHHKIELDIEERLYDRPPRPHTNFPYRRTRPYYYDWDDKWKDYNPVHPIIARGFLVYSDGRQITATNLYNRDHVLWRYPRQVDIDGEGRTNLSSVFTPVFEDGIVYAALEMPVPHRAQTLQNVPITYYIPVRRLVALDLETGDVLWQHDDAWFDRQPAGEIRDRFRRGSITGAPVVRGGHLYVAGCWSEGTFQNFVAAIDRHTGELVNFTRISQGQQELNLFGRQLQECVPTPVTVADGVIYYGTNLGAFAAVDAVLGSPLWVTTYDIVPIPSTYYWFEAPRRWPRFDNGPPVVAGDVVVVAPPDSDQIHAMHRKSGRISWKKTRIVRGIHLRTIHAADDERVYVGGSGGVVALWLRDIPEKRAVAGEVAWDARFADHDLGAGRGLLTREGLWIPTYGAIYVIDPASGKGKKIHERRGRDGDAPVNLVWGDGVLVTAGRDFLCARFHENDVNALAKERIRLQPDEVGPLLGAADIYLATGLTSQAVDHYRRAKVRADAQGLRAAAARAQRGLHRARLIQAEQSLDEGAEPEAQREYEKAFRAAPDDRTRLRARLGLDVRLANAGASATGEWRLKNLRAIESEHGDAVIDEEESGRSARGWALRQMAEISADRGEVRQALAVLHRLIEIDPAGEDGRHASRRIRRLLERSGRHHYDPYERRAQRLFEAALKSGDLEALERGLRIYANAEAAVPAALDLARRQLAIGDAAAAGRVLQQFLVEHPRAARIPEALTLMLQAMHARKSFGPAYAVLLRLKTRHPEQLVPRKDGARVPARDLAEEWLRREPYRSLARSAQRRDLEPDLVLRFEKSFAAENFVDVPELLGQRPEVLRNAVIVRAHTRVIVLDVASGDETYRLDFGSSEPKGPLVFAGGSLHAVTSRYIHVFDARTGRSRARRKVPDKGRAERLLEHQGQVFLLYRERGARGRVGLAALHPEDGGVLWSRLLAASRDRGGAHHHTVAQGDRLLVFSTHPLTVTVLDSTTGGIENKIVVEKAPGTSIPVPPVLLPDGRLLLGLVTPRPMQRFEYRYTYGIFLINPASPPESAILWTYRPRHDDENRYLHLLSIAGEYAIALDEARGTAVLELQTGRELKFEKNLPLSRDADDLPYLETLQPRHDTLLLVLTRSVGDTPARLSAFELPDLRPKYSIDLTESSKEIARLIEAEGVLAVSITPRRRRIARPRIRLFDPLAGRLIDEIQPPSREIGWITAKVQNGILLVTTSENMVYGFGPK